MTTSKKFSELMESMRQQLAPAYTDATPQLQTQLDLFYQRLSEQMPPHKLLDSTALSALLTRIEALAEKQHGAAQEALLLIAKALEETIDTTAELMLDEHLPPMPASPSEAAFDRVRTNTRRVILRDEILRMNTAMPPEDGMSKQAVESNFPQMKRYIDRMFGTGSMKAPAGRMGTVIFEGMPLQMGYFKKTHHHSPVLLLDQQSYRDTAKGFFEERMSVLRTTKLTPKESSTRKQKPSYDATICAPLGHICRRATSTAGRALRDHLVSAIETAKAEGAAPDAQGFYAIEVEGLCIHASLEESKRQLLLIRRESALAVDKAYLLKDKEVHANQKANGWKAQFTNQSRQYQGGTRAERFGPRPPAHPDMLPETLGGNRKDSRRGR